MRQDDFVDDVVLLDEESGRKPLFWFAVGAGGMVFLMAVLGTGYYLFIVDGGGTGAGAGGMLSGSRDPVLAVKYYGDGNYEKVKIPAFRVDDDWVLSYDAEYTSMITLIEVNSGKKMTYLPRSSRGKQTIIRGGEYLVTFIVTGDIKVAVFQNELIPLKEIPANRWQVLN